MIKGTTIKASLCVTALFLSLSTGVTAKAETNISDIGIAGIAAALDNYFAATEGDETGAADEYMESLSKSKEEAQLGTEDTSESADTEDTSDSSEVKKESKVTEVTSPYANLGISIANDYVNIRSEANTESEVVGKLYRGCATDIMEVVGDWVKIHSGNVDGYIKAEYLAIGADAEALIEEFATKYATVINTQTLRVREEKSTEAATTTLIPEGESYYVVNEYDDWAEIQIDDGDAEEGGETGFVSKDYIKIDVEFQYAISIEEEEAKLAAEEAAKQAEIQRLEELAQQQADAEQAEAARKAAAEKAAKEAEASTSKSSTSTSSNTTKSSSNTTKSSSDTTQSSNDPIKSSGSNTSGQKIADYAVNFVGNPYVWSGTSLTNGADCSGFVYSIYKHFGYSISRTSRDQASNSGVTVSLDNLQPGDLVFYCNSGGTVNHVALYIGGGRVVHASNRRDGIKISNYRYRTPYKAKRIL